MKKNILVINSFQINNQPLIHLFTELQQKNCAFYLLANYTDAINQWQQQNWPAKKIYLGPNLNKNFNSLLFTILLPELLLAFLAYLTYYKFKKKISIIICLNWNEKIIITFVAKILGLKTLWFELPNLNYQTLKAPLFWLYKLNTRWSRQIAFTNLTKVQLKKLGLPENNIKKINPGIKLSQFKHQDTIFNELAQTKQSPFKRKYFTIGTITDLNQQQNIEALFKAIKISLTVISDLQLIIVGDGKERKKLTWLAKKMEIGNLVWFVGPQDHIYKWLDSFDVYVVSSEIPNLNDFAICLQAMAAGLPIIAPYNFGFEDIIQINKTGLLVEANNSEILARQIISLQQNNTLRFQLGKNAREQVKENFIIEKMTNEFCQILNS